jgi:ABC-type transport system involved in multi-copper enzyme maturation permease subunit
MLRIIGGIVVGFVVMAVIVMIAFAIPMAVLGLEGILQPGAYWTTTTFNIIVLVGGLVAAILGGLVCRLIARNAKAAFALAAIVLAFGIGSAVMNMNKPDPPARTGPVTKEDMAAHGKEPTWFAFSKTIVGAVGVLIGSAAVSRRKTSAP